MEETDEPVDERLLVSGPLVDRTGPTNSAEVGRSKSSHGPWPQHGPWHAAMREVEPLPMQS